MDRILNAYGVRLAGVLGLAISAAGVYQSLDRQAVRGGILQQECHASAPAAAVESGGDSYGVMPGTKVRLKANAAPLVEVLRNLENQSKIAVFLARTPTDLGRRLVTLDTGETTFWQALDALCRQAKIHIRPGAREASFEDADGVGNVASDKYYLVLDDGATADRPTAYLGGVRLRLVPYLSYAAKSGAANDRWMVEVLSEPNLRWQEPLELRWSEATAGDGRRLACPVIQSASQMLDNGNDGLRPILLNNLGNIQGLEDDDDASLALQASQTVFRQEFPVRWDLPIDAKTASLQGRLRGMDLVWGPALRIADLTRTPDLKNVDGKGGYRLLIEERQKKKDGKIEMQIVVEKPRLRGRGVLAMRLRGPGGREQRLTKHGFKIWDAQDRPYKITAYLLDIKGRACVYRLSLDPAAKNSAPKKLEYHAIYPKKVEKPFAFWGICRP